MNQKQNAYVLVLTTENGDPENDPTNIIVLEEEVYKALRRFVGDI